MADTEEKAELRFQLNCTADKVVRLSNKVDQLQERLSKLESEKSNVQFIYRRAS